MTTFNAGAIEANLTLGRSSWVRDLQKTKKEIADLERQSITIGIDADADNALIAMSNVEALAEDFDGTTYTATLDADSDELKAELDLLDERLDRLDERRVSFMVDADTDNAYVGISLLNEELDSLDREQVTVPINVDTQEAITELVAFMTYLQTVAMTEVDVDINLDINGYPQAIARLATLEGQIDAMDGREIDVDIDMDRAALGALTGPAGGDGSGGHLGLLRILIYALIALSPVLVVAMGAAGAAVVGFTGAVVAALGPLAVLGAGLAGLIARFNEAKEAGELTGPMQQLADALDRLSDAADKALDAIAPEGFELMADAVDLLADIVPTLVPIFEAVAEAMGGVLDGIRSWVESPEYDEMINFFTGFGVDMLVSFMDILGNLILFFGRLFDAMRPFIRAMMSGLEEITAGWAAWASELETNDSFQQWLDNALLYGPMVLDMLGSFWRALLNIGEALRPFAGPMIEGFTRLFDFIANMDPGVLTIIIGALAGLWLGLHVIAPLIGVIVSGFTAFAAVLGFLFSPIGVVVALIVGLIAVIVHLWKTNATFRNAVIDTWNAIKRTVVPIVRDVVAAIRENWGPIKAWARDIWNSIKSIVVDAMVIIRQIVRVVTAVIREIWRNYGDDIIRITKWAFGLLGNIIQGAFRIIKGIFQFFRGLFTGDTRMMWEGIKNIWRGAMQVLGTILRGLNDVTGAVLNWLRNKWDSFVGFLKGIPGKIGSALSGMWDGITDGFRNAINTVIGWWNNLNFSMDIPNKIPGLPDSITINSPNVPYLGAEGGFFKDPTLSIIGEGQHPEVLAPEPVLERIVREQSGANFDYRKLAAAITEAMGRNRDFDGITREDLFAAIAASGMDIKIDATMDTSELIRQMVGSLSFELRRIGFGGKRYV